MSQCDHCCRRNKDELPVRVGNEPVKPVKDVLIKHQTKKKK
jgi:hypothetical protein